MLVKVPIASVSKHLKSFVGDSGEMGGGVMMFASEVFR